MSTIIGELDRAARRRLRRMVRLSEGTAVAQVARLVEAARSTVYRWVGWYRLEGEAGLRALRGGRPKHSVSEKVVSELDALVEQKPDELGYLRSSWTSELLAMELNKRVVRKSTEE